MKLLHQKYQKSSKIAISEKSIKKTAYRLWSLQKLQNPVQNPGPVCLQHQHRCRGVWNVAVSEGQRGFPNSPKGSEAEALCRQLRNIKTATFTSKGNFSCAATPGDLPLTEQTYNRRPGALGVPPVVRRNRRRAAPPVESLAEAPGIWIHYLLWKVPGKFLTHHTKKVLGKFLKRFPSESVDNL